MTLSAPWLRFDFAPGPAGPGMLPLVLAEPVQVLEAWTPAEVLPALRAVQAEADAGRWAAGFVAYEAAPAFDAAMSVRHPGPDPTVPLLCFGVFPAAQPAGGAAEEPSEGEPEPLTGWTSSTARADYDEAIGRIRLAIARGDTYQVNHTLRLHGPWPATDRAGD